MPVVAGEGGLPKVRRRRRTALPPILGQTGDVQPASTTCYLELDTITGGVHQRLCFTATDAARLHCCEPSRLPSLSAPQVVLSSGDASAELYLHGATLTSWKVGGERLIFVSPKAVFAPPKAIRGGVPVCFPQFAMLGPLQVGGAANVPNSCT